MAIKKAIYKVKNENDFDEIMFKTTAEQVFMNNDNKDTVKDELNSLVNRYAPLSEFNKMKDSIAKNKPIIINDDVPVGTMVWVTNIQLKGIDTTVWKVCNGQSLNRTEYEELFNAISTTYGANDNNTFNLPNLMGEKRFVRACKDDMSDLGKIEEDGNKPNTTRYMNIDSLSRFANQGGNFVGRDQFIPLAGYNFANTDFINTAGMTMFKDAFIGDETRPKNISLIPMIKVKNRAADMVSAAQEWTRFKDFGGTINGDLTVENIRMSRRDLSFYGKRAIVGYDTKDGDKLFINYENDFKNGIDIAGLLFNNGIKITNLNDFKNDTSLTGFQKLPSGLILQWGRFSGDANPQTHYLNMNIPFNFAFPAKVITVFTNVTGTDQGNVDWACDINTNAQIIDNKQFRILGKNLATNWGARIEGYWFAIGH